MKYTRYQYKKNKKNRLGFVAIIIVAAIISFVFFIITKNNTTTIGQNDQQKINRTSTYYIIQCGVYKEKKGAEEENNKLASYGNSFIVSENEENKILMGIYLSEDECNKTMENLTKNEIDKRKASFSFKQKDYCDYETAEMTNGIITVLNKFTDKDIKVIKTVQLKKWTSNLKAALKDSKNYKENEEIRKYIQSLPAEIERTKLNDYYNYMYLTIKKLSQN